jgi:hypothetical protein
MPRIRNLKPDLWADEGFGSLDYCGRLTWIGLITQADDEGRLLYRPRILRTTVFPYDDSFTDQTMIACLEKLERRGMILVYEAGDNKLIQIVNWSKHQKPSHPYPSLYPAPEDSRTFENVPESSVGNGNGNGNIEWNGEGECEGEKTPPRLSELLARGREIKGWQFTGTQDVIFFTKLLESHTEDTILKVIEDLRVYQEAPKKAYKNLHSTLRNWCAKETEWRKENVSEVPDTMPVDDLGRPMIEFEGKWHSQKVMEALQRDGLVVRTMKGYERRGNEA